MTIAPGVRFGSYEVLALLGEGGMGAVYRAHDTVLHRDVAIKVLLPTVAADPDRLARFSREAQMLAALNHAHIARTYRIEHADGVRGLAMEFGVSPALADRIANGPLQYDEALPIARRIVETFSAALQSLI